mgnify:CR=1 FL=1
MGRFLPHVCAALATQLLLVGCMTYPTSRTFYEPNVVGGRLRNATACGFVHTRDTVEIGIGNIVLAVMVGSPREPRLRHSDLNVTVTIEGPRSGWQFNPSTLSIELNDPRQTLYPTATVRTDGAGLVLWTIHYPEPAGLADELTIVVKPNDLLVAGRPAEIPALHFKRVRKSDLFVASLNC